MDAQMTGITNTDRMLVKHAAVLLPLIEEENGAHSLLYEVRAYDLDVQPGDVCFPGGGVEDGEDVREAVLREAEEELLISREQITLLETLPDVQGPGAVVHPFTGLLKDYRGTFAKEETDHVFTVPVAYLKTHPPDVYETYYKPELPNDFPFHKIHDGRRYPLGHRGHDILFYDIPKEVRCVYGAPDPAKNLPVLWGFTARLTYFYLCR